MPLAMAAVQAAAVASAMAQDATATAQGGSATAQAELAMATAQMATATPHMAMATPHTAMATPHTTTATGTATEHTAAADNALQQMTPPSSQSAELPQISSALALARWIQKTADDLAQEEANSNQIVGKRMRSKRVKFAGE